ncbi:MAG: ABC transporter substrate-binding protein [Cellulomonadaceae bacterium]|jgi:polar amino acid transport system substrate-binding protein|nr:ABC transporter substrate-binding protein [Cellulomonadaceae bacterium]
MNRTRALVSTVAAITAALLALTACTDASQNLGDSNTDAPATGLTSKQGADLSAVSRVDDIAALLPSNIASAGRLVVGNNPEYAPMEFLATDGQTPIGVDIDMMTAMATVLGLDVDIRSSSFDQIIPSVGSAFDIGMSAFTITETRMQTVTMISYFKAGSQYAVQTGNPYNIDPANLCGVIAGVQTNTVQHESFLAMNDGDCADNPITIMPFDTQGAVTTNLIGGRIQVMDADSPVSAWAVELSDGQLEKLGDIRNAAPYGIVVSQDDTQLAEALRAALQHLMDNGIMSEITQYWGVGDAVITTAEINPTLG